jgi:hypothetical protein
MCLISSGIILSLLAHGGSVAAFDKKSDKNIIKGVLNKELTIMPQLNKLNFGFGWQNGMEYYYEKTISKLFFQDKKFQATVIDVIIEKSDVTLELSHPILGTGLVRFAFRDEILEQADEKDIQRILLETLGDENHQYVFVDPQSRLYHSWSCNHLSDPTRLIRLKREDAEQQGYRASGICFKKVLYLPQVSVEKAIAREWAMRLREFEPMENNSEKQAYLTQVGNSVLRDWPFKRIGYAYSFYLSKNPGINAFAIPAGKIIITTALFDALANEEELKALLVYAIAHIEQRHSLKNYHACLEDEEYTDIMKKLATVASVLAGPVSGGISGAIDIDAVLPEESCNPQSLIGYQSNYIQEADSIAMLYFDIHGKDRSAVISLIKKLQFSELSEKLHPDLRLKKPQNVPYYDRIKRMQTTRFLHFQRDNHYILEREGKPPIQLDLMYQQIFNNENKLHIYIDDRSLLQFDSSTNGKTLTLSVKDRNGIDRFALIEDSFFEDVWGMHLTLEASNKKRGNFLENIQNVVLSVDPANGPNNKTDNQPGADSAFVPTSPLINYTFVPGKIDF